MPGHAGIYQDGKIHSIDYPDDARFVRVTGTNLDQHPAACVSTSRPARCDQMTPQQAT